MGEIYGDMPPERYDNLGDSDLAEVEEFLEQHERRLSWARWWWLLILLLLALITWWVIVASRPTGVPVATPSGSQTAGGADYGREGAGGHPSGAPPAGGPPVSGTA